MGHFLPSLCQTLARFGDRPLQLGTLQDDTLKDVRWVIRVERYDPDREVSLYCRESETQPDDAVWLTTLISTLTSLRHEHPPYRVVETTDVNIRIQGQRFTRFDNPVLGLIGNVDNFYLYVAPAT